MRTDQGFLEMMRCPSTGCGGALELVQSMPQTDDGHVMQGDLKCVVCSRCYPIRSGIPRFLDDDQAGAVTRTTAGFGYEWQQAQKALQQDDRFASDALFLEFIAPVQPDYFRGRTVLDAGCGMGRFVKRAHDFGAARIVGTDLSGSVEAAFAQTRHLSNVLIIQADLFNLPLTPCFDYIYSVGVLHHTKDPGGAFDSVAQLLVPGGGISAWVYGLEKNQWLVKFVDPIRKNVTSRLPHRALMALSYVTAAPLYAVLQTVYKPAGRPGAPEWIKKHLFYFDYLNNLSGFSYPVLTYTVFDHLVPALTAYIAHDEFKEWFRRNGLENVVITPRAGNSWRGFATKPSQSQS